MLRYEVTLDVAPERAGELERYMRERHIPEIRATGCFANIRFDRAGPGRFRTSYHAATRDDLERYLVEHTARFRTDFVSRFPDVTVSREVWEEIERWG